MKILKTILFSLLLTIGLVNNGFAVEDRVYISDLNYAYDFSKKKCERLEFDLKKYFYNKLHDGMIITNRKYDTDAGLITEVIGKISEGSTEKTWIFADTYGACKFYDDVIEKNLENRNIKNYINLPEPK